MAFTESNKVVSDWLKLVMLQHGFSNIPLNVFALLLARGMTQFSQVPTKQMGAAIINQNGEICGLGANRLPKGFPTTSERLEQVKNNYNYRKKIEHATDNAIKDVVYNKESFKHTTIGLTHTPCIKCAESILDYGIEKVVDGSLPNFKDIRLGEEYKYVTLELLPKSGVEYIFLKTSEKAEPLESFLRGWIKQNYR